MNEEDFLVETKKHSEILKDSFKCLNCKEIPEEPYFSDVCDHLLCKSCISKANTCPICGAAFFQKELRLNKTIKESILYINSIISLANGIFDPNQDDKPKPKDEDCFLKPMIPSTLPNITRSQRATKSKVANKKPDPDFMIVTQEKTTKPRQTRAKQPTQQQVENKIIDESQKSSTQSKAKKNKKVDNKLQLAIKNGNLEDLKEILIDPSVNINSADNAGWTPLHEAVNQRNIEIVKLLVEHGSDVNALNMNHNTPLHEAVLNRNYDCIKFLLENGANQAIKNLHGLLPVNFAKGCPDIIEIFKAYPNNENPNMMYSQKDCDDLNESICSTYMNNLNISCSYKATGKRSRSKAGKKALLFGTGMNNSEKEELNNLASRLNIQVAKEMNNNVTHVVFSKSAKFCLRTLNYMKAILMGIWIVNLKWLEDSVEKDILLDENEYESEGSNKINSSNGPFKGRINASSQFSKLLEDCNFFLLGEFKVFEKNELVNLLKLAGANILKREPKLERVDELIPKDLPHHLDREINPEFSCSTFILYDVTAVKEIRHKYLNTVKPNWLFCCIDLFKILPPDAATK